MIDLGTFPVQVQHHLAINEREQSDLVNALAFFHAIFDPQRRDSTAAVIAAWQDVARDTHLPSVDALASKIAALQRP